MSKFLFSFIDNNYRTLEEKKVIYDQIEEKYEKYNQQRKQIEEESEKKKMDLVKEINTLHVKSYQSRKSKQNKYDLILKEKERLAVLLEKQYDNESKLSYLLQEQSSDINLLVQYYTDLKQNGKRLEELLKQAKQVISQKKDIQFKAEIKKMTNKDKATALLYLKDINDNGWDISLEVINRLNEITN